MVLRDVLKLPNPKVYSYLGYQEKGRMDVIRTPFADKEDPNKLLGAWMRFLRSRTLPEGLLEFEIDLAKKVGPMSWMLPLVERLDSIEQYYSAVSSTASPFPQSAINAVLVEWSELQQVHNKSKSDTILNMKLSTNSGCPYFERRSKVLNNSVAAYIEDDDVTVYPDGRWRNAAILGWRGQEGGPDVKDVKQRVIWMFPFAVNIMELQFYQSLIECAQNYKYVPAWISNDEVDSRITALFDTKERSDPVICTDFTAFDQHFNRSLQDVAKAVFGYTKADQGWLEDVFDIKYRIPLVISKNRILEGRHGMASGSGGTNADETIAHRALQHEAAIRSHSVLNPNSMCLGDDGILTYPGITLDQVLSTYTAHGLEMNASKQSVDDKTCTYLRRWHSTAYRQGGVCVGVYSTCRALGRMMFQERFYDPKVWGPKAVAMRQYSILENVEWHPLREEFAEWCMKRDKYRLGLDIPGFLDNISSEFESLKANIPDLVSYNQEQLGKGIQDWWIVQWLKSRS